MSEIIVLGAGMVGVSTALALQARGHQVLLVDRGGIGRETSYGNAGMIQTEAVEPHPFPRDLARLRDIALKSTNDVNWHLGAMPVFAGPLLDYWRHSAPEAHARASGFYSQLVGRADQFHRPLIEASHSGHLIEHGGYRSIFRTRAAFDAALRQAQRVRDAWGVPFAAETPDQLAAAEPGLRPRLAGAIHHLGVLACRSPGGLTAAYGRLFLERGGRFVHGDAESLERHGHAWSVLTEDGLYRAESVVIALGPWSPRLTGRFGLQVPMLRKRGYHRHYAVADGPRAAMMDAERGTFIARMNQGLRLTTGAELTHEDGRIDMRQIHRSEASTRELFTLGRPVESEPWFGERPFIPDMLPVLGEIPDQPGLWVHFGHGHQGFTAGPASADLFVQAFEGADTPLIQALGTRRFR